MTRLVNSLLTIGKQFGLCSFIIEMLYFLFLDHQLDRHKWNSDIWEKNENMAKKLKTKESSILQNFWTVFDEAVKKMSCKLGLRKSKVPKSSNDLSRAESDFDINASVNDGLILLSYRSSECCSDSIYSEWSDSSYSTTKKRWPSVGSNFSKIPLLSEIPKTNNPAAWVSSKTQKDTKPIKNWIKILFLIIRLKLHLRWHQMTLNVLNDLHCTNVIRYIRYK